MTKICIALVRVMGFIVYVLVRRYRIQAVPVVTMNKYAERWKVLKYNSFIRRCSKSEKRESLISRVPSTFAAQVL